MSSPRISLMMIALGIALAARAEAKAQLPPPEVTLGSKEVRVPLTFYGNRPVIEARFNGSGPYRFYFDTGASGPALSSQLAKELKLKSQGTVEARSGGDDPKKPAIKAELVQCEAVEIGAVKLKNLTIVALDRARLGPEDAPAGVLTPAIFPGYLVTIDYPKKELRLQAGALGEPDGKTLFAYLTGVAIPSLKVRVPGLKEEMDAHLDSGSGGWLTLPMKYADMLPLDGKAVESEKKAGSVSGQFAVKTAKLRGTVAFGQFSFENPEVRFSDVVRRGNLGSKLLERFVVTLDVKNRRFRLEEATK